MAVEPRAVNRASFASNLAGLLLASLACIAILTVAVADRSGPATGGIGVRELVILAIIGGAFVFMAVAVALLLRAVRAARSFEQQAAEDANRLRGDLAASQTVIQAEASLVLVWDHQGNASLLSHNLGSVPQSLGDILRFKTWLDNQSADDLRQKLDAMFRTGEAATLIVRTNAGGPVEAQCRTEGGRAYLKLRDAAGERFKFAELQDQYHTLAKEIDSNKVLLDSLPMLIWYHGADGRIEWVNQAYVGAVDATSLEDVLTNQLEILETRDRVVLRQQIARAASYHQRVHIIIGGERRAFDLSVAALGSRTALFATDAAALELAEGELSRQSAANEGTLDRVSTAVAIFGPDQRLTFHNEAYVGLWQIDSTWLTGRPKDAEILDQLREQDVLPDAGDYRKWRAQLLDCYRTLEALEDWWHLPDGRTIHFRAEPRPDGGIAYLYDDVTERLALERGYNELIGVQRETLDNLGEGVAVFAPDGRLRLFNPAFARIWKLGPDELDKSPHIEDVIHQCRVLHDEPGEWNRVHCAVAAISDVRESIEGQMMRPDGSAIAYACTPLPDSATLLTFLDITDRMRVERALIERTEALEAADRLKNDFVSHVSYELRTPLTNIIGFSELLRNRQTGTLNEKQREYLGDIHVSSNTLLAIINDILDLATIDAGAFALNCGQVFVADIIEGAALGVRERLNRAQLKLDVVVAPGVNDFIADQNRIKQVLYNLLSNAIGFSEPGGTVHLGCRREDDMIVFSVSDQGIGIPEDMQSKIFERFESNSRGTKHRGAGLGLAIAKSLVELHDGTIHLRSAPDIGTAFEIHLPETGARRTDYVQQAGDAELLSPRAA